MARTVARDVRRRKRSGRDGDIPAAGGISRREVLLLFAARSLIGRGL
jgi:hypothetical protein